MGASRLTCAEVVAWTQGTGRTLLPWEFSVVRDMSSSYLLGLREGEDMNSLPPYSEVKEFDRDVVSKNLKTALQSLKR